MNPLRRAAAGYDFSMRASDWNNVVAAAQQIRPPQSLSGASDPSLRLTTEDDVSFVPGDVGLVDTSTFPSTDEQFLLAPCVTIKEPTDQIENLSSLIAVRDDCPKDGYIKTSDGISPAQVTIVDELHEYAYPVNSDRSKMQSGGMGYRIIWKESAGTGDRWCLVRMSHFGFTGFWGTLDDDIADGAFGLCTVITGTIPTASKYTVWNEIYGEDVGAGAIVTCKHFEPVKAQIHTAACEHEPDPGITNPVPN